ncbi:cysteine desulfurase [Candidatus Campbellbacteria bacterium]|nr:MAG: cysteine desulfurase [Candidatus Campbellbacteria bacterium]
MSELRTQKSHHNVYLDYAAATPLDVRAREAMSPYETDIFANPRSLHASGVEVRRVVESARSQVAAYIGVTADEVYFTHSGTDGNTRAIVGVTNALQDNGMQLSNMHCIVGSIEHSSVRSCAETLSRRGMSVSYAPVTQEGILDIEKTLALIHDNTVFISHMLVNNEIGTLQPITELASRVRELNTTRKNQIIVHTDASQAPLWLPVVVPQLGVDLMTLDAHKMYGPKGVGALVIRNGTPYAGICGILHKKDTDEGGTPNVPAIVGFAEAFRACEENRVEATKRVTKIRDYCIEQLRARFPEARIHGSVTQRIANNINVSFPDSEAEFLVTQLSLYGISVSAKSACLSGGGEGSYVIAALDPERKNNALRITLGKETTHEDIEYMISVLVDILS